MSATDTTRDDQKVLDEHRVRLAEAAGRRIRLKDEAKRRWRGELQEADRTLAEEVLAAREGDVPWSEISSATGIARQNLFLIVGRAAD